MDKLKQWVVLTVVACVAIAAAGWFLVVAPKRTEAADLRTQAADVHSSNASLQTQLQVLKAQAKELPKEQAKLAGVAAKIPGDPALPSLIRALIVAADETGVELVSLAPGTPAVVAPPAPAAPADPAAEPAQQSTPPAPAQGPAAPAPGPAGQLAEIPLAIEVSGSYFETQAFLAELEALSRAVLVGTLNLVPGNSPTAGQSAKDATKDGSNLLTTISAKVFMAANRPAPVPAAVPGAEAPAAEPATAAN